MSDTSEAPRPRTQQSNLAGIGKRLVAVVSFLGFNTVVLFAGVGRLTWIWGWIFLGICLASIAINATFLLRTSLETIAERGRGVSQIKGLDRIVSTLWALALYLALPLVAGLDVRFGWSRALGLAWHVAGAIVLATGLGLAGWAMIANAYFSTAVRIQSERGHAVRRDGPYRFVRHPGYLGFILQSVGTSLLLGSLWVLVPGIIAARLIALRTSYEDRTLQAELPGYLDFVQDVRYRLVAGIW
jgi:protein-S-isoprenylcysteine O-methyltransferase Ste14